jgi:hypothetical protein
MGLTLLCVVLRFSLLLSLEPSLEETGFLCVKNY